MNPELFGALNPVIILVYIVGIGLIYLYLEVRDHWLLG
jgi:hypothetical protein